MIIFAMKIFRIMALKNAFRQHLLYMFLISNVLKVNFLMNILMNFIIRRQYFCTLRKL